MKKFLNKLKKSDSNAPRPLKEIQDEYGRLAAQLGQNAYQQFVLERESATLTDRMGVINREAFERNKVDAEAKKDEEAAKGG